MTGSSRAIVVGDHEDAAAAARLLRDAGHPVERSATGRDAPHPRAGDLLVVDEWTAETAPHVVDARAAGARVTVLAELILARFGGRVLAVTGTAGKTSVCHLSAAILRQAGREVAMASGARAANAWPNHSLVDVRGDRETWLVAELTSTHLCHMDAWRGADVGVLTALWPDHVELHGSVERYVTAKVRLLDRCRTVVTPDRVNPTARTPDLTFGRARPSGRGVWVDGADIRAVGPDGVAVVVGRWSDRPAWAQPDAVLAACAAALACGVPPAAVMPGLRSAPAPPHRLDLIGTWAGVRRVDDSAATTPSKTAGALRAIGRGEIVLVAGGLDHMGGVAVHDSVEERAAFDATLALAAEVCRAVVPFGPAGRVFATLAVAAPGHDRLAGAIDAALAIARPGDTVLVSPMFPMEQADRDAVAALLRAGSAD